MSSHPILLSPVRWRQNLSIKKFAQHLLSSFGVLWLLAEMVSFFSQEAKDWLTSYWWLFLLLGAASAVYSSRPRSSFSYKLSGRDVVIEVLVADAFRVPGALVVPTNTTFDTDLEGRISRAPSIQGRFLRDYYDSNLEHLDLDIEKQLELERYAYSDTADDKPGKRRRYEIGTVIRLQKQGRLFYLLALTHISPEGRAHGTEEDLGIALAKLWYYLGERGDKCDIVIPVIGTGHARLPIGREEVVRDITRSFIASCSSRTPCNKLTIAMYPPDVARYGIDLCDLDVFLEYSCRYAQFDTGTDQTIGKAIG
ncbi:MAG: hypothetical protein FJY85_00380 [Deltaproteobacteria bacterium]|nr:hypothetical protein [Deltaproteobacteria bacterium]